MHKLYLSFHEDKFYSKQKNTKELEHLTPFKKKKKIQEQLLYSSGSSGKY